MNPRGYFLTIAAMLVLVTILLLVRDYRPDPLPPPADAAPAIVQVVLTVEVLVPTATPTATPLPTSAPRPTKSPTPTMVPCDTPVPNMVCQWTIPPPPSVTTATPIPVCRVVERIDGLRCRWPDQRPTATMEAPTNAPLEGMR